MLRRTVLVPAVLVLAAIATQAGEIKVHDWETLTIVKYIPQQLTCIDVVMDVGYWVEIVNQNDRLKLQQESIHTYSGCMDLEVLCNFNLTLSCWIESTGAIPGKYTCQIKDAQVCAPGGTAQLCAKLKNADLSAMPGGSEDVHVATVHIMVVPQMDMTGS